jgi:hypothetical protein
MGMYLLERTRGPHLLAETRANRIDSHALTPEINARMAAIGKRSACHALA